ncbi:LRP2-binding protein isoform X1 [Patella vulgata]|uniref:LRP2-binding protein isoform X1 n=1 Tax=Patella vulgata TaxID=6465 RepID=UPI00217F6379|nr:LRP2-binding protein isoform X1 [Patella vulgata]
MELPKEITAEKVHFSKDSKILNDIAQETSCDSELKTLTEDELLERIETVLNEKIINGEKTAFFQLGLFYIEQELYEKAYSCFEKSKDFDSQSMYQYGVMLYDGIGCEQNTVKGVECLLQVAQNPSNYTKHLMSALQYNIGRAYFQGFGVNRQSDIEAERWWLLAADDGNPKASVKAQSSLGMFYSREECLDLKKAFFWHSEACGNGSLESQGALGVMYEYGIGVKHNSDSAYICLKEASDRGNVYAMGNLVAHYYRRKLFTKASALALRVAQLKSQDIKLLATETECLPAFISKGISTACFYLARSFSSGLGIQQSEEEAKVYYSRSFQFDPDVCARLQNITTHGVI